MPIPRSRPPAAVTALAALAVAAGLLLTACSGSGESTAGSAAQPAVGSAFNASGAAGDQGGGAAEPVPAASAAAVAGGAVATADKVTSTGQRVGSAAIPALPTHVIRNAQVSYEVQNLTIAAALVRQVAADLGGSVSSETTGYSAEVKPLPVDGTSSQTATQPSAVAGQSVLVLRIPVAQLDAAIDRLNGPGGKGGVGKQLTRSASSQDVTGDVADLSSRVTTQKASVARIRQLLDKASSLNDIVFLESQLTQREADLEALQSRLASLADRADLATLTVLLQTPEAAPPAAPEKENSFLAGLHSGWDAVVASTTVILTVLGALLPVAIVLGAIGWPSMILSRRLRRRRPQPLPAPVQPPLVGASVAGPAAAPDAPDTPGAGPAAP